MNPDTLYFFSGSADKPPGKGINEHINDPKKYKELENIKNWRKVLSNFYTAPFEYNKQMWNSAEHAFHGEKISLVSKRKAKLFSLDSNSELSKGGGFLARENRKMVLLNAEQLEEWDFIQPIILKDILKAKFIQIPLANKELKLTHDAILLHGAPRIETSRMYLHEQVRKMI